MTTTSTLYSPPDAQQAYEEWKATCGPAAFAALLGKPLSEVRSYFPKFPKQSYANPTDLRKALEQAGKPYRVLSGGELPRHGLAFLQITGPWDAPDVPVGAAYRHTHWIATCLTGKYPATRMVYDINNEYVFENLEYHWRARMTWEQTVMSLVVAANKKATGWRVRTAYEVEV